LLTLQTLSACNYMDIVPL